MSELSAEIDRIARVLMAAWEEAEGKPVGVSYVATFADMARAIVADKSGGPGSFWTQTEWSDWSNDLARLIPEGDVCEYSNPEGAQEGIISDCLAAYIAEREVG